MKYLFMVTFLLISSCSLNKQTDITLPSDGLLAECIISPPPNLSGDAEKDKLILAGAWSLQTSNLGKCNQKLKTLQVWKSNTAKRIGIQ